MNKVYFDGYGYFKVDTDNFDEAIGKLSMALATVNIEFYFDKLQVRDSGGSPID